ncbi:MAG: sigma-70 family RNA polymerase sigma factor [candidate division WOR-3 bacterium]
MVDKTPKYLDSDAECVKRALQKEVNAYQVLYERYKNRIYRYIWLKVDNKEDARDLTEQTFNKAFMKLAKLKEPTYFRQWLFKIANNEIKMYHRSQTSRIKTDSLDDAAQGKVMDNPGLSALSQSVIWTLQQLNKQEQEIIRYRLIEKKEIAEIAKITGKKIDAVKYLLRKARKRFIKIYKKNYNLGPEKKEGDKNEKV